MTDEGDGIRAAWQHTQKPSDASWTYPIIGILYFAKNRFLWPLMKAKFVPCLFLSACVLATLFIWTYLPQVAFLAIFHGHAAWLNATILVLGEGAAVTALLFEAFLVDETLMNVFDSVRAPSPFSTFGTDSVGRRFS